MSKRARSPNYPAISLPEALERLERLWEAIQTHPAPREDIATGLGYSGLHGKSATAVSALRKYGLLDREGVDLRISERGMMCLHPESPQERVTAIQEAAREPELFATLTERFPGGRKNEDLLRNYLLRNNFTSVAANNALLAYRDTMELVEQGSQGHDASESVLEHNEMQLPQATEPIHPSQGPPFRAGFDGNALEGSFRLTTPEEIDTLVQFLQINKVMITPVRRAFDTGGTAKDDG